MKELRDLSNLPRCSIPLVYLGMCPDCQIALDLRDKACPKCASEHVSAFPTKPVEEDTK